MSLVVRGCIAGRDAARHDLGLSDRHRPWPLAIPHAATA